MTKATELKEYLIGKNTSFLLNDTNNGKTIMLSGAWGSGKTHFWINEIEEKLSKSLNNKACIYVSLYGKNDIETIKNEILIKAYAETTGEANKFQKKAISAFSIGSKILSSLSFMGVNVDSGNISNSINSFFKDKEMSKAIEYISDGGVICLDDFERKSDKISLNDLFGFISQVSLDMNCKMVIILNSEVFTDKEAQVFKTVKEKTINKFFNFSPNINELFESIFSSNIKYRPLEEYKKTILGSVAETKELNARLYIQVLDNCLEWIEGGNHSEALRVLTLSTVNFIKNHFVFETMKLENGQISFKILEFSKDFRALNQYLHYRLPTQVADSTNILNIVNTAINTQSKTSSSYPEDYYLRQNNLLHKNKDIITAVHFYTVKLNINRNIDQNLFQKINDFVYTGILT